MLGISLSPGTASVPLWRWLAGTQLLAAALTSQVHEVWAGFLFLQNNRIMCAFAFSSTDSEAVYNFFPFKRISEKVLELRKLRMELCCAGGSPCRGSSNNILKRSPSRGSSSNTFTWSTDTTTHLPGKLTSNHHYTAAAVLSVLKHLIPSVLQLLIP